MNFKKDIDRINCILEEAYNEDKEKNYGDAVELYIDAGQFFLKIVRIQQLFYIRLKTNSEKI